MKQEFVKLLTVHQNRLYSYVVSLVGSPSEAEDILQEINVVLWEKMDEAMNADSFTAWAYRVAQIQVMAYHRDHRRDRHVFDPELLSLLNERAVTIAEHVSERRNALESCLARLDDKDRTMIELRYREGHPIRQIASQLGRTVAAITQSLYRVRLSLLECIEQLEHDEGVSR